MSKEPKASIGVILFKGEKYLKQSLNSLMNQDYPNVEFLFRDQSPNGEAYDYIQKEMPEFFKKAKIEKGGNLWHSGGHNALIRKMKGDYYFCCSNDMWYPKDFVSRMINTMEMSENDQYGSATCRLMQWDFIKAEEGELEASKTNRIDSLGIGLTKGHNFFDIGQGESNYSSYLGTKEIFGPSGALAVFRKETLDDVAFRNKEGLNEYFDELLHYKNDVDLAYRMQWAGYSCLLASDVVVYHDRQVSKRKIKSNIPLDSLIHHKSKSKWVRGNSLFGHLVVLKKNYIKNFSWKVRWATWLSQLTRFIHTLIFDSSLIKQYHQVQKFSPEIRRKKKAILRRKSTEAIERLMQ